MPFVLDLRPCLGAAPVTYAVAGDALLVNGEPYDFGPLEEGEVLPREAVEGAWLQSDVTREGGVLHLAVLLPYRDPAPVAVRYPAPLAVTEDGPVALPTEGAA